MINFRTLFRKGREQMNNTNNNLKGESKMVKIKWEQKAHRLIHDLCMESYKKENYAKNGMKKKRHHPYRVPELAQDLVDCVKTDNEEQAKYIFLTRV